MTTNGNSSSDLPPPTEAEEIIDCQVGEATTEDGPVVWIRVLRRNEAGHPEVLCTAWMNPETALRLSHGIRDIAQEW